MLKLNVAESLELVCVSVSNKSHRADLQVLENGVNIALDNVVGKVANDGGEGWLVRNRSLLSTATSSTISTSSSSITTTASTISAAATPVIITPAKTKVSSDKQPLDILRDMSTLPDPHNPQCQH